MKILVCIKQVPESDSSFIIDDSQKWIYMEPLSYKMNRFDESALEEALSIRDRYKSVGIDVLSVGTENSKDIIRRALGMGADAGIHILNDACGYISPFLTASYIVSYIKDNYYDLVFTGAMSEDYMQGQVGPLSAEMTGLPCVSFVVKQEISPDQKSIYVEREMDGGLIESFELTLPALLTIQGGINKPRYPSLSNMLRANRAEIRTINSDLISITDPKQINSRLTIPEKRREGYVLSGSVQEKASKLIHILSQKSFIN
ncbi:MAG: electron transfer flavoprotein subunit beta/FixA family protein [Desulfobacterales bacterium]|jgi:electron transfer flavoprotein beta subunit|nr:electron transfer flavoprotein subunit beta/FixA family protein [Desulfobacterales bacterium]